MARNKKKKQHQTAVTQPPDLQRIAMMAAKRAYEPTAVRSDLPEGWSYLRIWSTPETAVWRNMDDAQVLVAFRGTKVRKDIGTDLTAIVMNQHGDDPRYRRSFKQVRRILRAFPTDKLILAGHSLGGHIASTVGLRLKEKRIPFAHVFTFNRGSFVWDIGSRRLKNETEVRHSLDPISLSSQFRRGGKFIKHRGKVWNPIESHMLDTLFKF